MSATKPVRPALHCALPVPSQQQHVPVTSPGNLQSALEFWVKPPPTETTPLVVRLPPPVVLPVTCPVSVPDDDEVTEGKESACAVACQVFVPFMVGGFGTVAAGLLLDIVQNWTVFQEVPEMFVLVPALLGLKGNLEMTLASRISTLANMGSIDSAREQWKMALGNLSLLQCQSLVLGLLASLLASGVGWAREGRFNADAALLLCLSALATAAAASLLLGSLTIAVVVACRRWRWDPDNVAAPLSASMGDVVTLALLALLASRLHAARLLWLEATAAAALLCLIPAWAVAAHRNPYTRHVLRVGWLPIVSAVAISSGGGYILNFAVARFKDIAACQPVINGVGGNLVAVQACRVSTYLHRRAATPGGCEKDEPCVSPCTAWFGKSVHARTCRLLVLLSVPGHVIFIGCVHYLKTPSAPMTAQFLLLYLAAALIQVALLLYAAHVFVHWLWRWGFDPDDAAIPYLTALGDLLGTALLLLAFVAMDAL